MIEMLEKRDHKIIQHELRLCRQNGSIKQYAKEHGLSESTVREMLYEEAWNKNDIYEAVKFLQVFRYRHLGY